MSIILRRIAMALPTVYKKWARAARHWHARVIASHRQAIESYFNALDQAIGIQYASRVRSTKGVIIHTLGRLAALAIPGLMKALFCS